jgi:hypothetical protein
VQCQSMFPLHLTGVHMRADGMLPGFKLGHDQALSAFHIFDGSATPFRAFSPLVLAADLDARWHLV